MPIEPVDDFDDEDITGQLNVLYETAANEVAVIIEEFLSEPELGKKL